MSAESLQIEEYDSPPNPLFTITYWYSCADFILLPGLPIRISLLWTHGTEAWQPGCGSSSQTPIFQRAEAAGWVHWELVEQVRPALFNER
jgi:hypothetical protein